MKHLLIFAALFLAGCTSKKNGIAATVGAPSPAPTSSSSNGLASVQLTWNASTGSPSGYYVEESTDGTHFSTVGPVVSSASTSALVGGLSSGNTYYFRVRAYNSGGYSPYSSVITVQP